MLKEHAGSASFKEGESAIFSERYEEAFKHYQEAAGESYLPAHLRLAHLYARGSGTDKSLEESKKYQQRIQKDIQWFQSGAEKGNSQIQYLLGLCYETGTGVKQDEKQAASWYRKSAEQKDPAGQYYLGLCYEYGVGVEKDAKQAAAQYKLAADQGLAVAQFSFGVCSAEGIGVAKNKKQSFLYYEKAALQKHARAAYFVAHSYRIGIGVGENSSKFIEWGIEAAKAGSAEAQMLFMQMGWYAEKVGIPELGHVFSPKKEKEAFAWYQQEEIKKESILNTEIIQFQLANCYLNGWGVTGDKQLALHYAQKAAERGLDSAGDLVNKIKGMVDMTGWSQAEQKELIDDWLNKKPSTTKSAATAPPLGVAELKQDPDTPHLRSYLVPNRRLISYGSGDHPVYDPGLFGSRTKPFPYPEESSCSSCTIL